MELRRRTILSAAGIAAVAASGAIGIPSAATAASAAPLALTLPRPTGPYPIGRTDLHLIEESRPDPWVLDPPYREYMVSIWYPACETSGHQRGPWLYPREAKGHEDKPELPDGVTAGTVDWAGLRTHGHRDAPVHRGRFPVIVYNTGHFEHRNSATILFGELVSRGYIVIVCDHAHETWVEFPDGRVEFQPVKGEDPDPDPNTWLLDTIQNFSADSRYLLNTLEHVADGANPDVDGAPLPKGLRRALDLNRVGALGTFKGGGTGAMQHAFDDDRVSAVYSGDASLTYTAPGSEEPRPMVTFADEGLRQPLLVMRYPGSYADPDPAYDGFFQLCDGPKWELEPLESGWISQSDWQHLLPQLQRGLGLPGNQYQGVHSIGTIKPKRSLAAQRAYTVSFFDRFLKDEDDGLLDGPSADYPEVRYVRD